ncbi:MAG: TIGR01212 family radical SAM protein [Fibrobacterota bacterium]
MELPYRTYRRHLRETFGHPVIKVPLNAGFSCPNKENGRGGCTFCDNSAFSPVHNLSATAVLEQFRRRNAQQNRKPRTGYIPYFQPNTNTYAPVRILQNIYEPLLREPHVVGLAVGTRPDALNDEICDYLADIAQRTHLTVELGLQSSRDATLQRIRRGHSFADFADAVQRLARRSIEVVTHVMIGLPGETHEHWLQTVRDISALPVQGVKFHQLMVIAGTEIEAAWYRGEVQPLSREEYAPILGACIELTRPDIVIHRIMADTPPQQGILRAPAWSSDKQRSLAYLQKWICDNDIRQGAGL